MQRILSRREKTILILTASLILFSIIFNLIIAPILNKNSFLDKEIAFTGTKLNKYWRLLNQKETIETKYAKFFTSAYTSKEANASVSALSEIGELAKNSNIRIIDLRPKDSASSQKELIINLRAEGDMEGYTKFIYNLERSMSALNIKEAQISAKSNTSLLESSFSISQLSSANNS